MQHTRLHLKYPGVPPPPAPSTTGFAVYAARLQRIFLRVYSPLLLSKCVWQTMF